MERKEKLIESIALQYCKTKGFEFMGDSIFESKNPRALEAISHARKVYKNLFPPSEMDGVIDLLHRDYDLSERITIREVIEILETKQTLRTRHTAEV
jgi:hypothetical protein